MAVFTKYGFARSTTRNIAREAGVSEVTLFRHFESKDSLFTAVMETYGSSHFIRAIEESLTGEYRRDLMRIGTFFTGILLERAETVALVMCEAKHFPALRPMFAQLPATLWRMLARYLRKKMDEGVVRQMHAETAAQAFFSAFYSYGLQKKILELEPDPAISDQEFVAQIVDMFYEGTIVK
jgi:AcrR family transcriptional regulator